MADGAESKSFRNFLLIWAVLASLAAIGLGVVTIFLLLRLYHEPNRSIAAPPQNVPETRRVEISESSLRAPSDDVQKSRTAFDALPRGTQTFDGVTFQIRRPVNIIGTRAALANGREFGR